MKLSSIVPGHLEWLAHEDGADGRIQLRDIRLQPETLVDAVLHSATFDSVDFREVEFVSCDFRGTSFFGCDFHGCRFSDCGFEKCEFHDADFTATRVAQCDFAKSEWYQCDLRLAAFVECDFSWSVFLSTNLRHASLRKAMMEGSVWDRTMTYGAAFEAVELGARYPARIRDTIFSSNGSTPADPGPNPNLNNGSLWRNGES